MVELNQFAPNEPVAGLYVYQANLPQLHNNIISANQTTALTYGAVVTLDSVSNADAPVIKQAEVTDLPFGVIVFTPIKAQFVAGERVALARANDIIWMPAAGAITQGATLCFTAQNQVTAALTEGNGVIGRAITSASEAGQYVQVELNFLVSTVGVDVPE